MMKYFLKTVVCVVVVGAFFAGVESIKCITCTTETPWSSGVDGCGTGAVKDGFKLECGATGSQSATYKCTVETQKYSLNETQNYIRRGCTPYGYEDGCAVTHDYLGYTVEFCVCSDGDNCNSSMRQAGSLLLTLAVVGMKMF